MTLIKPNFSAVPDLQYMSLSPSMTVRASDGQGPGVGLEAPEYCAAGDLCNHDEVHCADHSSAVMNSADHRKRLWLPLTKPCHEATASVKRGFSCSNPVYLLSQTDCD